MAIKPLEVGVCSWSLQVTNVPQLEQFMKQLGVSVCQIAMGDPVHEERPSLWESCRRE